MSHSSIRLQSPIRKKVVDFLFFWWFDGRICTTSYRSNSFKFKSTSEKKGKYGVRSLCLHQIKHHTQTNHTETAYRSLLPFSQLILIWNLGLWTRTHFFVSSDNFAESNSISLFICRFLSLSLTFFFIFFVCNTLCTISESAFVFIIECALVWFMARPANLKYESSFGFRWFVYSPLFFILFSTSSEPCLSDRLFSASSSDGRLYFFFVFFLMLYIETNLLCVFITSIGISFSLWMNFGNN